MGLMRGLFGDFSTMPLKDLVFYLGNRRVTGTLLLERSGVRKQAVLQDGKVVGASSNEAREFLGQFLINMGHITEEQFTRAYETQLETQVYLGKILVMIGAVTEQVLHTALSLKFRETMLDAFAWSEGTFSFDAGPATNTLEGVDFAIELLDLHREAEFRETAWQAILAAFPSGKAGLILHEENFPEPPRPGSLDARIVSLVKEGCTIDEIKLSLHATDFFLYQRLYALYRLDVVTPAPAEEPDALEELLGEELSPLELLEAARAALGDANPSEAEQLARRAHDTLPSPEAASLLAECEAALLERLRGSLMERGVCPSLRVPPEQLRQQKLSAPERYLLSRVNGRRDIHTLVTVSPVRELEALKAFQRFIDSGLVSLGRAR